MAVLDTGVAYADHGRFVRSPDFRSNEFVRGYDFVSNGPYPEDHNGHGTQVAGTGITLTSALSRAHASGAQIADHIPTPGATNQY